MTVSLDVSDDLDYFDGVETVTYARRAIDGTEPVYSSVKALRRATSSDTASYGDMTQSGRKTAKWHLKAKDMAFPPRRGDRIASVAYGTWEVLSYEVSTFATRYACECLEVPT